jgi:hypothetical protein
LEIAGGSVDAADAGQACLESRDPIRLIRAFYLRHQDIK